MVREVFTTYQNKKKNYKKYKSGCIRIPDIILVSLASICFISYSWQFYRVGDVLLATAKGFGFVIRIFLTFVLILVNRPFMQLLSKMTFCSSDHTLYSLLSLDHYRRYHIVTGYVITVSVIGHVVCHLLNNPNISEYSILITVTGFVGTFCIMVLSTNIFIYNSPRLGFLFQYVHSLALLFTLAAILHVPRIIISYIPVILCYIVAYYYQSQTGSLSTIIDKNTTTAHESYSVLSVQKSRLNHEAGQFFILQIPDISKVIKKPFTAMESLTNDTNVEFRIRKLGFWTSKLHNLIQQSPYAFQVVLRGPYGIPANRYVQNANRLLFLSTGIGMTPSLSYLISYIKDLRKKIHTCEHCSNTMCFNHDKKEIWLVWSVQTPVWMELLNDVWEAIAELKMSCPSQIFRIYVHITSVKPRIDNFMERSKLCLLRGQCSTSSLSIKFGRGDYIEYLRQFVRETPDNHSVNKVHICSNTHVLKQIIHECKEQRLQYVYEHFSV